MSERRYSMSIAQATILKELQEAVKDSFLGQQHDGSCEMVSGKAEYGYFNYCHLCAGAKVRRSQRLKAAFEAAGPELEKIME